MSPSSSRSYQPVDATRLPPLLADVIAERHGPVRVAVDGPDCASPHELGVAVADRLRERGRDTTVIPASLFWRDASLRLEAGRRAPEALAGWLDAAALRREVLDALVNDAQFLPSLRDPVTDRPTRAPYRSASARTVVLVCGSLLLGRDLPFDVAVHLSMSSPARTRRTSDTDAWALPAFDDYEDWARPVQAADVVVRVNDPQHPAIHIASGRHAAN